MAHTPNTDPLSLANLISWLETMPADERYEWSDQCKCMLGRWVRSIDRNSRDGDKNSYNYIVNGRAVDLCRFADIALAGDATFGAALDRARKALVA